MSWLGRQLAFAAMAVAMLPVGIVWAQAKPVPQLDYGKFLSPWYEIARFPIRKQKGCSANQMIAYSESDKKHSFQFATSCQIKGAEANWWDANGKLDEHGTGALRLTHWFILHSNYWVLAVDPDYQWALVGNPNHKSLWILAKTPTLQRETMDSIKSQATAAGYNVSKLVMIPYQPEITAPPPIKPLGKGKLNTPDPTSSINKPTP